MNSRGALNAGVFAKFHVIALPRRSVHGELLPMLPVPAHTTPLPRLLRLLLPPLRRKPHLRLRQTPHSGSALGVNVWHGCAKRSRAATSQRAASPPPPPPATSSSSPCPTDSAAVIVLPQTVTTLESRCTTLTARFDAIDARIDSLVSHTLATLVESHQVVIASVTTLTEKLNVVVSRLERLGGLVPPKIPSPRASAGSAPALAPSSSVTRNTNVRAYVFRHHPQVIFIQEAFPGGALPEDTSPSLSGYISYVHQARNGLIANINSSMPHRVLRCSTHAALTFQLFEITLGDGKLRLCNVYSAPGVIHLPALPIDTDRGMIYMGDFNARQPALGDASPTPNCSGLPLLNYIRHYRLTHWDTGGATHARGGTLDHNLISGLVASRVSCQSIPSPFSDHVALSLQYSLPTRPTLPHHRTRIAIPPKYFPTGKDGGGCWSRFSEATHTGSSASVPSGERRLIALQKCAYTESWQRYTDSINHQTSVGTMWHLINRTIKKKPTCALHHSPHEYAQDLITVWSAQSQACNLPAHIQDALSSQSNVRTLRLMAALLNPDEDDDVPLTEDDLRRALAGSTTTAHGYDGLTYQVLRLLQKIPSNPLLHLFNLCFRRVHVPPA
ncbi:hypothetical protein GWK47_032886 [Chionoecetes opilio]|uniref:Endonuclease/exonuclease/phosphatase domain-containing protein n=1 Tax=Chionoecetes opilio TaxID=41210 RepID=A0A8J5D482_CHIOP|nr:hypothetical protein GWK47_032886 [Chionoecetes opilio]